MIRTDRLRGRLAAVAGVSLAVAGLAVVTASPTSAVSQPLTYACTQPDLFGNKTLDQTLTVDTTAPAELAAGASVSPKVTAQLTLHKDTVGLMKFWKGVGIDTVSGGSIDLMLSVGGTARPVSLAVEGAKLPESGTMTLTATGSLGRVDAATAGETIAIEVAAVSKLTFQLKSLGLIDINPPLAIESCDAKSIADRTVDTISVIESQTNPANPDPQPVDLDYSCPVPVLGTTVFGSTTQVVSYGEVDPGSTFDPAVKVDMTVPASLVSQMKSLLGAKAVSGTITSKLTVNGVPRDVVMTIPVTAAPDAGPMQLRANGRIGDITAGAAGEWIEIAAGDQAVAMRLHKQADGSDAVDPTVLSCSRTNADGTLARILATTQQPANPDPAPVDLAYSCPVPVIGTKVFESRILIRTAGQVPPGATFTPAVDVQMVVPADLVSQMKSLLGAKAVSGSITSTMTVNGTPREVVMTIPAVAAPESGAMTLHASGQLGPITAGADGEWIEIATGAQQLVAMRLHKQADASDAVDPVSLTCARTTADDGTLARILVKDGSREPLPEEPTPTPTPTTPTPTPTTPTPTPTPTTPTPTPTSSTPTTPTSPVPTSPVPTTPAPSTPVPTTPVPTTPQAPGRAAVAATLTAKQARAGKVVLKVRLRTLGDAADVVSGRVRFTVKGAKGATITRSAPVLRGGKVKVVLSPKVLRRLASGTPATSRGVRLRITASYGGSEIHLPVVVKRTVKVRR